MEHGNQETSFHVIWGNLRRIAGKTFRWFLGILAVGVLILAYFLIEDRRIEGIVSQPHEWEEKILPLDIPVVATLKTRCSSSRLYYLLNLKSKENQVSANEESSQKRPGIESSVKKIKSFTLEFFDRDGFEIISVSVKSNMLSRIVGENRQTIAYNANSSASCDKKVYEQAVKWSIGWSEK